MRPEDRARAMALHIFGAPHAQLEQAVADLVRDELRQGLKRRACPCEFESVPACGPACSCRIPAMSGGCLRCCSYGSAFQQDVAARAIVLASSLRVVAAAIQVGGIIYSAPRPAMHPDVIREMGKIGLRVHSADQGFLLSDGTFADRRRAEACARACGQLSGPTIGGPLTCEDLWSRRRPD